jgi:non-ribosomal peptide synthetase component F
MNATHGVGSSTRDRHDSKLLYGTAPLDQAPSPPENVTTLAQLFQHQARIQPNSVAFSCHTSNGLKSLTYSEADLIAETIGLQIARQRTHDDRAPVIAVWLEKGLDLVLAILATTYSGATWLPFDPDVPVNRATTCVIDAGATVIVCDEAHEARAHEVRRRIVESPTIGKRPSLEVVTFEGLCKPSTGRSWASSLHAARPEDACYLIYTSGTTGTPKGIAISQAAALTFVLSERAVLQTSPNDVVWNGFSPAFDMFVEEMWITICGGGHLAIGTREECQDVPRLPALWAKRGVTIVNAVPTLIGIMGVVQGDDDNSSLLPTSVRLINLGGEACPPALVKRLARPGLRIINTYGPTETT